MAADRALQRGVLANNDVAAIAALPNAEVVANEDDATLNVLQEFLVALFVGLFDFGDHLKLISDLGEALFSSEGLIIRRF